MMTPEKNKGKKVIEVTELTAAAAYAKAWNRLDPSEFIGMLDPDVCYSSQWVLEDLVGQENVANYLTKKMQTVKKAGATVYTEVAQTRAGKTCVLLAQGDKKNVNALVLFDVDHDKVTRFDMCVPDLY
jgi:hypothetical protein